MRKTVPWHHFEAVRPAIAAAGKRLLIQGDHHASAYLATVAPTGVPRVHPVFPVLAEGELWLFIVNLSPKYRDLQDNPWIALHSLPAPEGAEEFHLRGSADEIVDSERRAAIMAATNGQQGAHPFEALFRVRIHSALHTRWQHWGTAQAWPDYHKWLAS
jgi:hypothetical protein